MKLFTIGFTKTTAQSFFERLKKTNIKTIIDVRLNNISQLAGFAKRDDLEYFAKEICSIDYKHFIELAPTKEMLDSYKKQKGSWKIYENSFYHLMKERKIEQINRDILDNSCLLCSEHSPHFCHRRLVVEYLKNHWLDLEVIHL